MRPSFLLPLLLTTLFACAAEPDDLSDPPDASVSAEPGGGGGTGASKDSGVTRDGRATKDDGERSSTTSSSSVGGKKDPAPVDEGPPTCDKLRLQGAPNSPDILIVLDRSGSMVGFGEARNAGKNRWLPSVSAVKKLTSELTETVAFGLMLFPDPSANGGVTIPGIGTFGGNGMGGCTPGKVDVPVDINTADKIASVLDMSAPNAVGATPTSASLVAARMALAGGCADCRPTPKYILLVTDGQPTCGMGGTADTTPEDIAATNAAIDDLTADGVKTYVIGYDTASDPAAAAAMDGFAVHGGTDKHYPVEDEATLIAELTRIAGALVPCEFELSMDIPDPTYVRVEIDGVTYNYGSDWTNDGKKIVLDPMGQACPRLRDAKLHDLKITRECEIIPVQ